MKKSNLLFIPSALAILVIVASFNINPKAPEANKYDAGQGMYLEFTMTMGGGAGTGTVKTYSQDGNSRTESEMAIAAMQGKKINSITITLKDSPNVVYTLNESNKTYTAANTSNTAAGKPKTADDYDITVLGKEKINNYNCTHVKVLNKSNQKEAEMWTSTDVVNYASLQNIKNKYLDGSEFFKMLEAKGAAGFPVRMASTATTPKEKQFQMDLVTAGKRAIDNSLFSLSGYTKAAGSTTGAGNYNQNDAQQKAEQIKNMTPAERQQYIQDLQKQAQQQAPH